MSQVKASIFLKVTGSSFCLVALSSSIWTAITPAFQSTGGEKGKGRVHYFILKAWPRSCKQYLCLLSCFTSGYERYWMAMYLLKILLHRRKKQMEIGGQGQFLLSVFLKSFLLLLCLLALYFWSIFVISIFILSLDFAFVSFF